MDCQQGLLEQPGQAGELGPQEPTSTVAAYIAAALQTAAAKTWGPFAGTQAAAVATSSSDTATTTFKGFTASSFDTASAAAVDSDLIQDLGNRFHYTDATTLRGKSFAVTSSNAYNL